MMKKILITGITGFLGRHLAEKLHSIGYSVYGTARKNANAGSVSSVSQYAEVFQGDLLDKAFVEGCVAGNGKPMDVVIHLAAITEHDKLVNEAEKSLEFCFLSTTNVLDAVKQTLDCHFIFPSSGKVYGKPERLPYTETHPTRPSNILGRLKLKLEQKIGDYAKADELGTNDNKYTVLRLFNVYGSFQKETFLIPTILKQVYDKSKSDILLGDIKAKRDYIFVDDVVDAFIAVIEKREKLHAFEVLNLGTGKSYSAEEIVSIISKLAGKKLTISIDKKRLRHDEFDEECANISKILQLGWKPKTEMKEGLKQLLS